jgi:hypothetical protein
MIRTSLKFYAVKLAASIAMVTLTACTTVNFKEPVTSYTTAMSTSGTIFSKYYSNQNELNRSIYFIDLKYNKNMKVGEIDAEGERTPLDFYYSPESLKARLDTLNLISAYSNRLAILAGADSPQRISDNTSSIVNDSKAIVSQLKGLKSGDPTINSAYLDSATTLFTALEKMYLENQQSAAVKQEIEKGHPAVNRILLLIKNDLTGFSSSLISTYRNQLAHLALTYNKDIALRTGATPGGQKEPGKKPAAGAGASTPMTESQRIDLLNQIQVTARNYETAFLNKPDDVVTALIQANDAIYEFAKDPSGGNSLVELNSTLESLNSRLRPFVDFYIETHNR